MKTFLEYLLLTIGSITVAAGLELILSPNELVDGGVTAISIMANHLSQVPIWVVLVVLNIPMLLVSAKYMGNKFVVRTLYANFITAISLVYLEPVAPITTTDVLILIYGGVFLGGGVGLVVKAGGAIDGTEMLAIWLSKQYQVKFSTFLFSINALILGAAAFVFTIEHAMFSVAIFFIVSRTVDFILDGLNQEKSIMIISDKPEQIGTDLMQQLDVRLTYIHGEGGYSNDERKIIYCITNRLLYPKVKELVLSIDPNAVMEASFVNETTGLKKR